jgi:hypothetical protein
MILRPGALLGLPEGVPDPAFDVIALRWVLLLLALVWAAAAARGRGAAVLAAGLAFAGVATGFWVLALGRPYGLLVDPAVTRAAAEASVVSASGSTAETFLAGEAAPRTASVVLAGWGVPARLLILAPTLLPPFFLAAVAVLVYAAYPDRGGAPLAASLWLAFSTGDLETLRGMGIVSGIWSHPWSALAVLGLALLALVPVPTGWRIALVGAAGLLMLRAPVVGVPPTRLGLAESCLLLTLDQAVWLPLAAWGLWRGAWVVGRVLVPAGAALVLAAAAWPAVDPWAGHALYRLGLILAACGPVELLIRRAGESLRVHSLLSRSGAAGDARGVGLAALLLALAPASFLAWWNPVRLDRVAEASVYPQASRMEAVMGWIRTATPRDAVFLAPAAYGPDVAVLAGRRVLRAPLLGEAADEARRQRVQQRVLAGQPSSKREHYNLRYVLLPPAGFPEDGIRGPEDLEGRRGLVLRYAADEFRIYELQP